MAVAKKAWTYADLLDIPEDISKRYEIIDGELYVSPSPRLPHQRNLIRLADFLRPAEEAGKGVRYTGPVDVVLDEGNVFVPDLVFISTERLAIAQETHIQGAPDLVVEVLSPSTKHRDLGVKLETYARHGVRFYWVVDTYSRSIQVFELQEQGGFAEPRLLEGDDLLSCPLFPELTIRTAELFS